MTENEKKIINEFLSKTLNLDTEALAGLYNEAGELQNLELPETSFKEKITALNKKATDQYSRGKKEAMTNFEKEAREKYEVEDQTLIGIDLLDDIVQKHVEKAKSPDATDITKHPDYVRIKKEQEKALKAKDDEWTGKYNQLKTEHERAQIWSDVEREALSQFDALQPNLPEDPAKAAKWKSTWLSELKKGNYKREGNEIIILNEDGTPKQDDLGNIVKFNDLVKNTASEYFDFKQATPRSAPATPPQPPKGPQLVIKTESEFVKAMKDAKTPEERIALKQNYDKNKQD